MVTGHYVSMPDLHTHARRPHRTSDPLRDLPGVVPRRVRPRGGRRAAPGKDATAVGCRGDLGHELRRPMRRSKTRSEFALEPRPVRETLADTVRWLVEVGQLTPRQAGRFA
jgi:hypothetical protein